MPDPEQAEQGKIAEGTRMMAPAKAASDPAAGPAAAPADADVTVVVMADSEASSAGRITRPEVFRPLDQLRSHVQQPTPGAFGGRYEPDTILGRGGMGEVWTTRDLHLDRHVALKRMRGSDVEGAKALPPSDVKLARFLREAQLTGSLEHPNIMPVYDLGLDDSGGLFFTMKRMRGHSLAELIERDELGSLLRRLDVFRKVCDAMAFAHAHGVIHRDLKPDNVMIGEFGEVIVLDWGLAKRVGEAQLLGELNLDDAGSGPASSSALRSGSSSRDSALTQAGSVIGTPAYMAPEQAMGKLDDLDARTDIYALGALLYTLLTNSRPFIGTVSEVMAAVCDGDFDPPSRKRPLARELDAIVCTAMAVDPAARYPSVEALRDDVQAFLEGHPVSVLRYDWVQRLGKWAGRNRRLVTGVGLTGALGLAGLVAVGVVYVRDVEAERARVVAALDVAEQAREVAEAARVRAELAEREAAIRAADAEVGLAHSLVQQGELLAALDKLDAATAGYERVGADPIPAALARARVHGQNPGPVFGAELPEGARIDALAPSGREIVWHVGERVVVDDWVSGERRIDRQLPGLAQQPLVDHSIVATSDGFVAARVRDGSLELISLADDALRGAVPMAEVASVCVGADGRHLLLRGEDGQAQGWDAGAGAVIGPRFECGEAEHVSADGGRALCRPRDTPVHSAAVPHTLWDTHTATALQTMSSGPNVDLSPDGRYTMHSQEHQGLRLVGADGQLRWHIGEGSVGGVANFSDDGRRVFSSGVDQLSWLSMDGEILGQRVGHGSLVDIDASGGLALIRDGRRVEIWATGPGAHTPTLPTGGVLRDFDLASDELLAVSVNDDSGVLVHDPLTGASAARIDLGGVATSAAFDDGGRLAVGARIGAQGSTSSVVALFDLRRQTAAIQQLAVDGAIMDVAFARGDRELLIALMSGELLRWDLAADRIVGSFDIEQCPWQLELAADGERVYVAGRDPERPEVEVWDIAAGRRVYATTRMGPAYGLALSPGQDRFIVAEHGGQPRTWAVGASAPLVEYPALGLPVMHIVYARDGALLYVSTYDGKGHIWDARSQAELLLLPEGVARPFMSADGHTLIGCGSRFVLDLAARERSLELGLGLGLGLGLDPGPGAAASPEQRALQLVEALVLQQDWANVARALDWAADAGAEIPQLLAGRVAWVRGDAAQAATHFRAALDAGETGHSLPTWLRIATTALDSDR